MPGIAPSLLSYLLQIARLCVWFLLLSVVFLPLERLFALHPAKVLRKDVWQDVAYYFLSSLTPALLLATPFAAVSWVAHHAMPDGYFAAVTGLPFPVRLLLSFAIGELGFYWGHRWSHEVPLLWRFHAVHHMAEHMDFLVNTRAHPVDIVFTRLCGMVPLYLLGLAAPVQGTAGLLPVLVVLGGTVWGFFLHSNVRWRFGWLEWLIATPGFHHWHHTNDRPELYGKNFASMLPLLDKAFGTLHLPAGQHPERYGIDERLPRRLLGQLTGPFGGASAASAGATEGHPALPAAVLEMTTSHAEQLVRAQR